MEFIIENVRCFAGRHVAPLAPVTILVGENSSGKSTLLAMARLAWDAMTSWEIVDFNEEPFRLGAFDDIVSTTPDRRFDSFAVGFRFPPKTEDKRGVSSSLIDDVEVQLTFDRKDAQPRLGEWSMHSGDYAIRRSLSGTGEQKEQVLEICAPSGTVEFNAPDIPMGTSISLICRNWPFFKMQLGPAPLIPPHPKSRLPPNELETLELLVSSVDVKLLSARPYANAPIRTRPQRTYDPLTDKPTPEGDHVPMMLAKLKAKSAKDRTWGSLRDSLQRFAVAAGLFETLDVKRLGGDEANLPFQLQIGHGQAPPFNLIDVGYGVSQVLPVLVDAITNRWRMLLLQQPEVHLHPRAQAELGSFLGRLASENRSAPILIETHSDYLLDRVCMDVRDKKGIDSNDVIILFLKRMADGATITPIKIDERGNLINAPSDYRSFFLAEERRFLQG